MYNLIKFFHLAAAIFWMGGMAFMVLALRPAAAATLEPPIRLTLLAAVLSRFFVVVMVSIGVLLVSGTALLMSAGMKGAPTGWHAMVGLGLLMMLVFGHIFFGPFRRLKQAVAQADWPEGGRRADQLALLVKVNLGLGWLAIAAVLIWK